jgi:hypothetical protein
MEDGLKNLTISFFSEPFPPQGYGLSGVSLLAGVCIAKDNVVGVYIGKEMSVKESALCHELIHYFQWICDGIHDGNHKRTQDWNLVAKYKKG